MESFWIRFKVLCFSGTVSFHVVCKVVLRPKKRVESPRFESAFQKQYDNRWLLFSDRVKLCIALAVRNSQHFHIFILETGRHLMERSEEPTWSLIQEPANYKIQNNLRIYCELCVIHSQICPGRRPSLCAFSFQSDKFVETCRTYYQEGETGQ